MARRVGDSGGGATGANEGPVARAGLNGKSKPTGRITDEDIYQARLEGRLEQFHLRPRLIDLFSGAGGLTLGFTAFRGSKEYRHTFEPVWANDFNDCAVATYNENFGPHCVQGDILELLERKAEIPSADVVIGGPPCQGFSLLNKNKDGDERRELWEPFLDIVESSGASVFVMENVPHILGTPEYAKIVQRARDGMGFEVYQARLCAADYGVPQVRWRAFIVGWRISAWDEQPGWEFPPRKTHYDPEGERHRRTFSDDFDQHVRDPRPWETVRRAFRRLPRVPRGTEIREDLEPPLNLHFGRNPTPLSQRRYKVVPVGGNRKDLERELPNDTPRCWIGKTGGTDLFGRLLWDRPSVTIRTEFFKPEKGRYLHPEEHRAITHREAARLQSFPDGFRFKGNKTEIAKQIGNAVPPRLAARIADSVYALLLSRKRH